MTKPFVSELVGRWYMDSEGDGEPESGQRVTLRLRNGKRIGPSMGSAIFVKRDGEDKYLVMLELPPSILAVVARYQENEGES